MIRSKTKQTILGLCALAALQLSLVAQADEASAKTVRSQSYALGANIGDFLSEQTKEYAKVGIDLHKELVIRGLLDAFEGESKLSEKEVKEELHDLQTAFREGTKRQLEIAKERNRREGAAFLEQNAQRENVNVTDSGLQYEVLTLGQGPRPAARDTVVVHYHGTLLNGEVFDSSVERGEPAVFPLDRVITGWTEGVQLMPVGSKFRFFIPDTLAYGPRQTGKIPPHSTLTFEVELLEIRR